MTDDKQEYVAEVRASLEAEFRRSLLRMMLREYGELTPTDENVLNETAAYFGNTETLIEVRPFVQAMITLAILSGVKSETVTPSSVFGAVAADRHLASLYQRAVRDNTRLK